MSKHTYRKKQQDTFEIIPVKEILEERDAWPDWVQRAVAEGDIILSEDGKSLGLFWRSNCKNKADDWYLAWDGIALRSLPGRLVASRFERVEEPEPESLLEIKLKVRVTRGDEVRTEKRSFEVTHPEEVSAGYSANVLAKAIRKEIADHGIELLELP